jgi:hypothetical protein
MNAPSLMSMSRAADDADAARIVRPRNRLKCKPLGRKPYGA